MLGRASYISFHGPGKGRTVRGSAQTMLRLRDHNKPHYLPAHNAANWFNAAHESYLYFRETPTSECTNLAASSEVVPRSHILSLLLG
jgi:hypothetical protein